jgi:peroxiredoxin
MLRIMLAAAVAVVLAFGVAEAGKFNTKLSIGDAAPAFTGLNCACSGKTVSLADFKKDVIVVAITCNHCPMAIAYEDRMIEVAKKFADKADFIAINVNLGEADGFDKMKERAKEKGFNFAYLFDGSQKIGRELGATKTPEFFVLNKERKVVYMGALDDNAKAAEVKEKYLEQAIEATLKGETVKTAETQARGCGVQYKK